jgi:hypothetical protein
MMLKSMITPDSVYLFKDARKVADAKVVDACWREILAWPAQTVLTFHDPAGHCSGRRPRSIGSRCAEETAARGRRGCRALARARSQTA